MALTESYHPADESADVLELTVGDLLRGAAHAAPDALALVDGVDGRSWTYAQLLAGSERVARALLERFEPGEHVAVWAPNSPEWVLLEYGIALAGMVLVTVNPAYRPAELSYVLGQSDSVGVFHATEYRGSPMARFLDECLPGLPKVRHVQPVESFADFVAGAKDAALPAVAATDHAQIQYTSGTTGKPKGALLRHRNITNNMRFCMQRLRAREGGVYVSIMPLFHTGGCVLGVLGTAVVRSAQVVLPIFDPAAVLDVIERHGGNSMGSVPTMLVALLEEQDRRARDLSSMEWIVSGGSTVPADLVRRVSDTFGCGFSIVFGQTEAGPLVTQTDPDDSPEDQATTLGRPLARTEVKIVDPASGATLPIGAHGELCTRGYLTMAGYYNAPPEQQSVDADGWLHTGDLCSMDERGYCRIEGRIRDMIIRGGENIYPREIEDLLFSRDDVAEAAVVGIPDERWGEIVAAFVRAAPGAAAPSAEELRAHCREHLAPHKTPSVWEFVDEFPLTPSGKIQKYVLRDGFVERRRAAAPAS